MATLRSQQEILESLDGILAGMKWKGPPSDISHLQSPNHLASFKKLGNQEKVTSQRIITQTLMHSGGEPFRICSIGCEDGMLDKIILEGLRVKAEYVGLDNDDQLAEAALEQLQEISPHINVTTMAVDYEDKDALEQLNLEQFDVIWMVNCTYYAPSLTSLLEGAFNLLKPSGVMLIISSSKESIEDLVTRFWSHQRKDQLHTTESVVTALSQLGMPHHIKREPIALDFTAHLSDNFKSTESKLVLDHLMFCRLTDYPPQVTELVIEFLKSIADTSSKVVFMSDLIEIHRK